MAHPVRRRLYAEVRRLPGLRLHELADLVGQTASSLNWHMQVLAKARLVVEHSSGQLRFFTSAGLLPEAVQLAAATSALRMYRRGEALAFLAAGTSVTTSEAATHLGMSNGAARNALDFLVDQGLAVRQRQGLAATYDVSALGRRAAAKRAASV